MEYVVTGHRATPGVPVASTTFAGDPPVRADDRCAQCGGPRLNRLPKVITQRSKRELIEQLALDPFCAATCARAYFGVDIRDQLAKGSHSQETREWAIGA